MALKDFFIGAPRIEAAPTPKPVDVAAADLASLNTLDALSAYLISPTTATRSEAMAVPVIARGRNIICSSIASIPLELRDDATGARLQAPRVIRQPDLRVPASSVWSFIVEDLLFYGYAYLQVTELYADTGRIRNTQRVAPYRVSIQTNSDATEITGYLVDGYPIPNSGIGSLAVFYGLDEGLLNRAGRTIKAAFALERAATLYAQEPFPTMILKSNGTSLPADRIRQLLDAWKSARQTRATAFLNADVTMEAVGFDPAKLQLKEAREQVATELSRALGLPAYFVDAETGSSMTYSNASLARQTLFDFSLRGIATAIEQRLSQPDFTPYGQTVRFALDDFLRGNALERAQVYEILNRIGAMSVDEIRADEDLLQ
jgi:HK97 family phage portal protein